MSRSYPERQTPGQPRVCITCGRSHLPPLRPGPVLRTLKALAISGLVTGALWVVAAWGQGWRP
jgi:hypothetical protein